MTSRLWSNLMAIRCPVIAALAAILGLLSALVKWRGGQTPELEDTSADGSADSGAGRPQLLVAYGFAGAPGDEAENNFRLANLDFFLRHAVTYSAKYDVTYRVTVSGEQNGAQRLVKMHQKEAKKNNRLVPMVYGLQRENFGYDFGSHSDMLKSECSRLQFDASDCTERLPYAAYIFLNDGTRGPFYPTYMPRNWHWTEAFIEMLSRKVATGERVALVGTSIVCLPPDDEAVAKDPSYFGPKVEGFAWAILGSAFRYVFRHGSSFSLHADKTAAIIAGEYNLSRTILLAPEEWTLTSLLLEHRGINFRENKYFACNQHEFPSRLGTYGPGISISPLEVVFHKAHWHGMPHVSEPEMLMYSEWMDARGGSYKSHLQNSRRLSGSPEAHSAAAAEQPRSAR